MATKLHFCPKCESLLTYEAFGTGDDRVTILKCSNCTYEENLQTGHKLRTSIYGGTLSAQITKAAIYDPSLRLSSTLICPNARCDSNNIDKLGTVNEEGHLIQPEVCITNHTSVNRENTYVCRICRSIFGGGGEISP
jgi:DNA-directed RNA polymerase subunit M/transcription elongation factor TFIIS